MGKSPIVENCINNYLIWNKVFLPQICRELVSWADFKPFWRRLVKLFEIESFPFENSYLVRYLQKNVTIKFRSKPTGLCLVTYQRSFETRIALYLMYAKGYQNYQVLVKTFYLGKLQTLIYE